jgi:hypothetical protein
MMVERTWVSIYEVDEAGSTGPWAGSGSLVNPRGVLVHIPFNRRIAERNPCRLRVALASVSDESARVEIVDVEEVGIDQASAEPIVTLAFSLWSNLHWEDIPGIYEGMPEEKETAAVTAFLKKCPSVVGPIEWGPWQPVVPDFPCIAKPWWDACKRKPKPKKKRR